MIVIYRSRKAICLLPLAVLFIPFTKYLNLYIGTKNIGGGLIFQHGFSTIVNAQSIGENCWINQQVTIGYGKEINGKHTPIIGNDVVIRPGSKIFGGITIGDDVEVGANAVVVKDIPSHSMVAGVPARIIKKRKTQFDKWESVMDE